MAIVNLSLESMKDDYLASAITLEAQNHYRSHQENVSTIIFAISCNADLADHYQLYVAALRMRGAAHLIESKKLAPGVQFLHRNILAGFPPNVFVVVDTHSDEFSGMLQHTGGHTGGTNTTITEILQAYLGNDFVTGMKASATAARNDTTARKTLNGKAPWCDLTAKARGGQRGLFMVSCDPAIRVSHHFEKVKALIDGGSVTLPSLISNTVCSFMMEMGVFGQKDVWAGLTQMLTISNDFLEYIIAVVVYSFYLIGQFKFKACTTQRCNPSAVDMHIFNKEVKVGPEDNKYFKHLHKVVASILCWHHFPPSTSLQNFFVKVSKPKDGATASASTTVFGKKSMSHKNIDKKGKDKHQLAAEIKEDADIIYISNSNMDSNPNPTYPMELD
ncbi:hypothetical protein EDD22DRAFT_847910 [Suillus occidentalis]|nr:hypothetical protein EDD22DRAFT_847910 [Suillus occidentalis]